MENIEGVIKAMTSYGSQEYENYSHFWNDKDIQSFSNWLLLQPKIKNLVLYRGYSFDRQYFNDANIVKDSVIDTDALTQESLPSFTTDLIRACLYINEYGEIALEDRVRVLFVIHTKGKYFVDISKYSAYSEEREYKCTDNAKLKVISLTEKANYLQIELKEI